MHNILLIAQDGIGFAGSCLAICENATVISLSKDESTQVLDLTASWPMYQQISCWLQLSSAMLSNTKYSFLLGVSTTSVFSCSSDTQTLLVFIRSLGTGLSRITTWTCSYLFSLPDIKENIIVNQNVISFYIPTSKTYLQFFKYFITLFHWLMPHLNYSLYLITSKIVFVQYFLLSQFIHSYNIQQVLHSMIGENSPDELVKQIQTMKFDLENNRNLIKGLAAKLVQNFFINSLPYVIFLLSSDLLPKIFIKVSPWQKQLSSDIKKQLQIELAKIVFICEDEVPQFFDCFCKKYIDTIKQIMQKYNKEELLKNYNYNNTREQFVQMIQMFIKAKLGNTENRKDLDAINVALEYVTQYQRKIHNQVYQQISINWLKLQIDQMRQVKDNLCCRAFFGWKQVIDNKKQDLFIILKQYPKAEIKYKVDNNAYKQVKASQKISSQKLDLARSIRNLMNKRGGVILMGPKLLSVRKHYIQGAQLDDKTKIATLSYIKQALNEVQPKHEGFQLQSTNQQILVSNHYQINPYISVQYIRLANQQTFLYYGQKQYIIRITVKMGHPKFCYHTLYHFLSENKQASIQFANVIEGQQNKISSIADYYQKIYKKFVEYQLSDKEKKLVRERLHDGCRICMDLDVDLLDLDKNQEY